MSTTKELIEDAERLVKSCYTEEALVVGAIILSGLTKMLVDEANIDLANRVCSMKLKLDEVAQERKHRQANRSAFRR